MMISPVRTAYRFIKSRFTKTRLDVLCFLARRRRKKMDHVAYVGITGSAGKTLTKELTASILAQFGFCRKTTGSYNKTWAVAYAVWHTKKTHRYCVAEVAAYGPGTIEKSTDILQPAISVLTVIGRDHYSAYKSNDLIASEKEKLITALPPDGVAVLNRDDPKVRMIGERCNRRVIWIGKGEGAELHLKEASSLWPEPLVLSFEYQGRFYKVRTQLHGAYQALSVMASLGVALALDLPLEKAIDAISRVAPLNGRMQPVSDNQGVVFIRDDYKSPHWSFGAPIEFLKDARASRKIVIIGTISDASQKSTKLYKQVCRKVREVADVVIFVGQHAHRGLRGREDQDDMSVQGFRRIRDAADYLQSLLRNGDLVLIKGSHDDNHLCRLVLNRTRPVRCWKDRCGEEMYCGVCPQVYRPSLLSSLSTPVVRRLRNLDADA